MKMVIMTANAKMKKKKFICKSEMRMQKILFFSAESGYPFYVLQYRNVGYHIVR